MDNQQGEDFLEKMVQDTYNLLQEQKAESPFPGQEPSPLEQEVVQEPKQEDRDSIPGPGVVYAVQFSPSTFILRILPLAEASSFFRPDSALRLKFIGELKRASLPVQMHYFPTDYFELAEVISESFSGKRYPINEDMAFEFDQFKDTWWMKGKSPQRFELRFSYPGEVGRGRYLKLGPLGDGESVALIFDRARSLLTTPFHLQNLEINERKIVLEGGDEVATPGDIAEVISGRKPETWLYEKTQGALGARFFRFLKEVQTMSMFWQEVEKNVASFHPPVHQ